MLLKTINEMANRGGNLEQAGKEYVDAHKAEWLASPKVGDLDKFAVRKTGNVYSLWADETFAGTLTATKKGDAFVIDDIWVEPAFRSQKLSVKLLLFLRTRENMQRLMLADVHSDDTFSMLKAGGLKLFKKHWANEAGETREFSPDTIDQFYGAGRWKLVLENTSDFSDWPRFNDGQGFTKQSYDVLLNVFDLNEDY